MDDAVSAHGHDNRGLAACANLGIENGPGDPGIGFGGQHLEPVGSRIVCETSIGLLWMDPSSFLHSHRPFQPLSEIAGSGLLTLGKLITFALT